MNGLPKTINRIKIEYKECQPKMAKEISYDSNGNEKPIGEAYEIFIDDRTSRCFKAVGLKANGFASTNLKECIELNHPEFKTKFRKMLKDRIINNIPIRNKYTCMYCGGSPFKFAID